VLGVSLEGKRRKLKQKCERLFEQLQDNTDGKCVDKWLKSVYDLAKLDKWIEDKPTQGCVKRKRGNK
jgi:hypothetical protein